MLRQLLALLALLSGLAAVGVPAQAAVGSGVDIGLEQSAESEVAPKSGKPNCVERDAEQKLKGDKSAPCRPAPTVIIVVPTVMFGPDRAYE
ncbi:MAG: hypothetical protein R3E14_00480 [Erythrobacter sp.]